MKVTVNFGAVRVIVPCGKGDMPVKRLMDLAVTRYKKATGKSLDAWVSVHNLKILSDGGILDPDDMLNDVADDREQIIATFEEDESLPYLPHNGGDGTSASSVGTASPDIFHGNGFSSTDYVKPLCNGSDVEITTENISSSLLPLHVRRGSEPALNRTSPVPTVTSDSMKRWSAAIMVDGNYTKNSSSESHNSALSDDDLPPGEREDASGEEKCVSLEDTRKEPLGGPRISPDYQINGTQDSDCSVAMEKQSSEIVNLKNEDGPLGIHVVPANNSSGSLIIQRIEPGGRIDRDGRVQVGDKITEINGQSLSSESFKKAQEIFKDALKAPEISLHCVKSGSKQGNDESKRALSPVYSNSDTSFSKSEDGSDAKADEERGNSSSKPVFVTPTKKSLISGKSPSTSHSSIRKVGRRILIHLTKGPQGLGFSISAKDTSNNSSLFIKNILSAGAAVSDGRLKVGDKLLEVNKVDVTGKSQSEVVNMLRKIPFGESVELIVSRPEVDNSPSPRLPRQLPPEKAEDGVGIFPWKKRDVFTFDIPLNDTGSAGLGVSVKGKTSTTPNGSLDMGIFVKSVIHGGAASKDGRLCTNDQLLNINGISLLGMTNSQAMETLRRAMIQADGPNVSSNAITLTIARRISSPATDNNESVDGSCHERSDSLLSESGDSFYVSNENLSPPKNKVEGVTPDTSTSDNSGNTVIFMLHSKKDSFLNESSDFQNNTSFASSDKNSELPLLGNNPVIERLTGFNTNEAKTSEIKNGCCATDSHSWSMLQKQPEISLIDADLDQYPFFTTRPPENNKSTHPKSSLNYKKSFSNRAKIDCSSPVPFLEQVDGGADLPLVPLSQHSTNAGLSQSPLRQNQENFFRNGFGRQSMPEKAFAQSPQQKTYSHNKNIKKYGEEVNCKSPSSTVQKSNYPSERSVPREMPVDVGPCETCVKLLPNSLHSKRALLRQENSSPAWSNSADSLASLHHIRPCIQKRSCHSPGCPYHAVPTTGRESGSSQATSVQHGPSLGMCKSSSLESLQTMVHELKKRDAPIVQEENVNGVSEQKTSHTRSATVDSVAVTSDSKKNGKSSKKKGLFKGLGSVFRFGKSSRKANNEMLAAQKEDRQQELERLEARRAAQEEQRRIQLHYQRLVEQQRLKQLESANNQMLHQFSEKQNGDTETQSSASCHTTAKMPQSTESFNPALSPRSQSRQERMHQLRAEHQRRHQERQGYYPREEQEELYEQKIRQIVDQKDVWKRPLPPVPHQNSLLTDILGQTQDYEFESSHSSTQNFDIYKEMSKPGSRKGFVDPNRYSHYMNFQEIQHHLQQFQNHQNLKKIYPFPEVMSRIQQNGPTDMQTPTKAYKRHYRHTMNSPRTRPISNFFEYETLHNGGSPSKSFSDSGASSLPRRTLMSNRQRLPIPEYMINSTQNQHLNYNGDISSDKHFTNKTDYCGFSVKGYNRNKVPDSKV